MSGKNTLGEIEETPERTDNTGPEKEQDNVSQEPRYLGEDEA